MYFLGTYYHVIAQSSNYATFCCYKNAINIKYDLKEF